MLPSLNLIIFEILNGLLVGSIYALIAVGLTLVLSILNMLSFCHGEFYMLGGYVSYFLFILFGIPPLLAIPLAIACGFGLAAISELGLLRVVYTQQLEKPDEYAIIVTLGLSTILSSSALLLAGPFVYKPPNILSGSFSVGSLVIGASRLIPAILGIFILAILLAFLNRTWWGKALQATAQNRNGARMVGINTLRANTLAFALGTGLATAAGSLLAPVFLVYPLAGALPSMKGMVIIVLGGMGSVKGALYGAIILGVVESLCDVFISFQIQEFYAFALLIIVLLVRPTGLFGRKERKA